MAESPAARAAHALTHARTVIVQPAPRRKSGRRRIRSGPAPASSARCQSPEGFRLEGAGGAERTAVIEIVQHRRQAHGEHLLAGGAQHELREEVPADAGEARVLEGEARAARLWLEPVGDVGRVAVLVADPRVAQQGELACLEDLAVDDPAPARRGLRDKLRGLRDELEPRADRGRETLRSRPLACGGPQRHERRVDHGTPDLRGRMGGSRARCGCHSGNSSGCEGTTGADLF